MKTIESYQGHKIEIFTSVLASGRNSYVVRIDGKTVEADIDGLDPTEAMAIAMQRAKQAVDKLNERLV